MLMTCMVVGGDGARIVKNFGIPSKVAACCGLSICPFRAFEKPLDNFQLDLSQYQM